MLEDTLLAEFAERRRVFCNQGLAAMRLAKTLDVYRDIMVGKPVLVANLHREPLRHALRGKQPPGLGYLSVTRTMLDAVATAAAPPAVDTTTKDFLERVEAAR